MGSDYILSLVSETDRHLVCELRPYIAEEPTLVASTKMLRTWLRIMSIHWVVRIPSGC